MDDELPQEDIGYVHPASFNDALTYIPFTPSTHSPSPLDPIHFHLDYPFDRPFNLLLHKWDSSGCALHTSSSVCTFFFPFFPFGLLVSPFLARFLKGAASPCVLRPSLRLLLVILPHICLCEYLTFIHPSSFILLVRSFIRPLDPAALSSPLRYTDLRLRCKHCLFKSRTRLPSIYPAGVQHAEEKAHLFIVYTYSSFPPIPSSLTFRRHCINPSPLLHPYTIAFLP